MRPFVSADPKMERNEISVEERIRATVIAGLAQASALEFKAVKTGQGRKGVRLEAAFWEAVARYCESEGISRSDLLDEILSRQPASDFNTTSLIRTFMVAAQSGEIQNLKTLYAPAKMITLLQHAPVAAFAMDRRKRLLQANREFLQVVRRVWGDPREDVPLSATRLTLATPVEEIFAALNASTAPVVSGIRIEVRHRQQNANAKIIAVPGREVEAVLGYIIL